MVDDFEKLLNKKTDGFLHLLKYKQ